MFQNKFTISFLLSVLSLGFSNSPAIAENPSVQVSHGFGVNTTDNLAVSVNVPVHNYDNFGVSFRPELSIKDKKIGGSASFVLNKSFTDRTMYSGFGVGTELIAGGDSLKPFGLIGLKQKMNSNYSLFGEIKLPFETVANTYSPVFSAGFAYTI